MIPPLKILKSRLALAKPRIGFSAGRHSLHGLRGVFDVIFAFSGFWVWGRWPHAVDMLSHWLGVSGEESQLFLIGGVAVAFTAAVILHWRLSVIAERVRQSLKTLRQEQKIQLAELDAQAESIEVGRSAGAKENQPRRAAPRL